jgi:transposase-like protein
MSKKTASQAPQKSPKPSYPAEVRQRAVELLMQGKGRSVVADELDVSEGVLGYWLAQHKKNLGHVPAKANRFTDEQKQRAMTIAQEEGLEAAAAAIGAGEPTVYGWLKKAGLKYKGHQGERGRPIPVSHDKDFAWMREDLPEYEAWQVLATKWIQEQSKNPRGKMLALRRFFQDYLKDTCGIFGSQHASAGLFQLDAQVLQGEREQGSKQLRPRLSELGAAHGAERSRRPWAPGGQSAVPQPGGTTSAGRWRSERGVRTVAASVWLYRRASGDAC